MGKLLSQPAYPAFICSPMPDFITYHAYPNPAVAQDLLALLDEQHILYKQHYAPSRFSVITGTTTAEEFVISLQPKDFTRVRALEEAQAAAALAHLPSDYYLFGFSNEELWELLRQPAAWSSHDVALASRLLRERGEPVTEDRLQQLRQQHTEELSAPDPSPTGWIVAGYVLALLGGVIGMGIGWSLWHYRKTLPDGRQVPGYAPHDQAHGQRIFWLGAGVLGLYLASRLLHLIG